MRHSIFIGLLAAAILVPGVVCCQTAGTPVVESASLGGAVCGVPSKAFGLNVTPSLRAGYGYVGMTWSMPGTDPRLMSHLDLGTDAAWFLGTVGVNVGLGSRMSAFLNLSANAPTDVTLRNAGVEQLAFFGVQGSRGWKGTKYQWCEVDGGVSVAVGSGLSAVIGLKGDQTNINVEIGDFNRGSALFQSEDHTADVKTNVVSPYFGVRFNAFSGFFTLSCSPWITHVDARIPIVFIYGGANTAESGSYFTLKGGNAVLLEMDGAGSIPISERFSMTFWGKAGYLSLRNTGSVDVDFLGTGVAAGFLDSGSASNEASVGRYTYSGGIGGALVF